LKFIGGDLFYPNFIIISTNGTSKTLVLTVWNPENKASFFIIPDTN
jgi:hypothetical protein